MEHFLAFLAAKASKLLRFCLGLCAKACGDSSALRSSESSNTTALKAPPSKPFRPCLYFKELKTATSIQA